MKQRSSLNPSSTPLPKGGVEPFARPDGSCLGRRLEDEDGGEQPVPSAPAGPQEPPADPAEPTNPA